jgi:hypothetical protein
VEAIPKVEHNGVALEDGPTAYRALLGFHGNGSVARRATGAHRLSELRTPRLVLLELERQGYDVSLTRYPEGWRCTFLRRNRMTRRWVGQVLSFHPTPWQAVQHAARTVRTG